MTPKSLVLSLVLATALPATGLPGIATVAVAQSQRTVDRMIERVFDDELGRRPSDRELRRYRELVFEDDWTERDIRSDLRRQESDRPGGGRPGSGSGGYGSGSRPSSAQVDRIIREAYRDLLDREPDPEGLRNYRNLMLDDGWSERDVRDAIRRSGEKAEQDDAAIDRMITRAYQDLLGRAPDGRGLTDYRRQVRQKGWTERDVRTAIRTSPEYREKTTMTEAKARDIVAQAYREVLGREPDPASQAYVQKVWRENWTQRDVERELRNSDEYRNKR